jgi:hypothetical protein
MSRTHKDVPIKYKKPREVYDHTYGTIKDIYTNDLDVIFHWHREERGVKTKKRKEVNLEYHWMSTPSWWTRITMTRPLRRHYHLLEHEAVKTNDLEDLDFPDFKNKPFIYYW